MVLQVAFIFVYKCKSCVPTSNGLASDAYRAMQWYHTYLVVNAFKYIMHREIVVWVGYYYICTVKSESTHSPTSRIVQTYSNRIRKEYSTNIWPCISFVTIKNKTEFFSQIVYLRINTLIPGE